MATQVDATSTNCLEESLDFGTDVTDNGTMNETREMTEIYYTYPAVNNPAILVRAKVERSYLLTGDDGYCEIVYVGETEAFRHHIRGHQVLDACPDCGESFDDEELGCDTCIGEHGPIPLGGVRALEAIRDLWHD